MKAFGLARIGKVTELRMTPSGDAVINLSLAFAWGKRGSDGNRATEWVDASLWGKRAEALEQYLIKGGLVVATMEDLHIETYQGKNGEGKKLVGRIIDIELAGSKSGTQEDRPAPTQRKEQPQQGGQKQPDFDDDIPF